MTCFIVFSGVLTLLFPFVPGYVRAILQILGFTFHKFPALPYEQEKPLKGVWAYEVFDIIYTFRLQLGIKKHQKITIFFKADANSLTLFQEHNVALKKILNIEQVRLLKLHEHEPLGYYQETFKGITVGIKVLQATSTIKKPNLNDLENQYAQQLEYFEYLRTIITNMPADLDTAKLQQKKDEMEEVKINLGRLQLAIQKIKIKYK
ncbi:MAG: hypothetical protein LBP53_06950 [Candidatus Peribacteria bacterium]|jgi:hypothetical protein|nr:hypothetical protein [Candidatus Peribacteria bacterium]